MATRSTTAKAASPRLKAAKPARPDAIPAPPTSDTAGVPAAPAKSKAPNGAPDFMARLQALFSEHGAVMDTPDASTFVPGAAIHVTVHHPVAADRFVEAVRATPGVRDVQLLSTGIRVHVVVPTVAQ